MADEDEPTPQELEARRRASAQGAAGDLARMGIDPRLLGLDPTAPTPPRPPAPEAPAGTSVPSVGPATSQAGSQAGEDKPSGRIVPLRPEFAPATQETGRVDSPSAPVRGATPTVFGPVEELLARTAAGRPAPQRATGWIKAVTFGLVTPDAADTAHNERLLVAALRTRQSERRVITFSAGKGGVGTTTVALGVGTAMAALRDDATVLVDARAGTPPLSGLMGLPGAPTARDMARPGSQVPPVVTASGLGLVDGSGWGTPLRRSDVASLLDNLRRDHTFTLFDLGNESGEAGHALLARSDMAVIVTGAGGWGLAAARVAAERLHALDVQAAERALFVVVCTHDEPYRRVHREVTAQLARGPARVVVIAPDPALAGGQPFDAEAVRPATREAMLEVAAALAVSRGRVG